MKKTVCAFALLSLILLLFSCNKDAGKLPNISFKSGLTYLSSDAMVAQDSVFTIGIDASKAESEDVLKTFNISKSINGGASASLYNKSLSNGEKNNYSYDFMEKSDSSGRKIQYTFTVTNRDGLINQVAVSITVK